MSEETKACPACAETIKAPAQICRFCQYDFRTGGRPEAAARSRFPTVLVVILAVGLCGVPVLAVIAAIAIPGMLAASRASNERNASASLKTVATAEADFRANDRDGNRVNDFWTGDVAGLYAMSHAADFERTGRTAPAIKLIELSLAGADAAPFRKPRGYYARTIDEFTTYVPKAGYWYHALETDNSVNPPLPYRVDTQGKPAIGGACHNYSRFGFVAFPDAVSAGKSAYFVNENYTIFKRDLDDVIHAEGVVPPGPPADPAFRSWPTDAELKTSWSKLD